MTASSSLVNCLLRFDPIAADSVLSIRSVAGIVAICGGCTCDSAAISLCKPSAIQLLTPPPPAVRAESSSVGTPVRVGWIAPEDGRLIKSRAAASSVFLLKRSRRWEHHRMNRIDNPGRGAARSSSALMSLFGADHETDDRSRRGPRGSSRRDSRRRAVWEFAAPSGGERPGRRA